ncbi:MAG TPA: hypothetical protein VEB65_09175 [Solirubrobacterales bacterium]|nr:hypothetical protein [Solirubrobacterales bacterium]
MYQDLGLNRRRLGLALLGALALAAVALIAVAPRADAARKVYFPSRCNNAAFEPHQIVVSCADGRITFKASAWQRWGSGSAHTTGVLVFPECGNKPLYKCDTYAEHEATITLSGPQRCNGRWQFRRLFVEDLEPSAPPLRQIKEHYPC